MTFYGNMATTATRLITKYGRQVTIKRYTPSVAGATGVVTKGAATLTSTAWVVVLPSTKGTIEAFDNRLENGSLAGKDLRFLKVAAESVSFEPRPHDEVTMDSATWLVFGCTPINPAGTALVYGVGMVKL